MRVPDFIFVSNYINHHQIPFCNDMNRFLGGRFAFVQTEPMEEERKQMGWKEEQLPYLKCYYEEPQLCRQWINDAKVVMFGGVEDESYILPRLKEEKPVIRCSERIYKTGQWKAISPRGLIRKYTDHTKYRNKPIYMLCAGGYVPSDFHIVGAYPGKLLRWGYFTETKHYDVHKLMEKKEPATILWAARFIDWKHPELALKAAKYLKDKGCRFQLRMVGGGTLEEKVSGLIKEYELSDCVQLLGYRTPAEVRELMEASDIFLQTSDRNEGWGAVINEAMNSGCAVVANYMIGAAPFLIQHGKNGLVYRDGSEQDLFEKLELLLKDRGLCHKMGNAGYDSIITEWNSEQAAGRLLAFCEKQGFLLREDLRELVNGMDRETWEKYRNPISGPCSRAPVISERKMYKMLTWKGKDNESGAD